MNTIKYVFQPKYATSVVKEFSIATHTGFVIYVSNTLYTGSTSDGIILEVELRNEKLRALLTRYGILLDRWRHDIRLLLWALKFVFIARNIEMWHTWGDAGPYHNVPPASGYFQQAPINRQRYPRPVDKKTKQPSSAAQGGESGQGAKGGKARSEGMCSKCELTNAARFV